MNTKAIGSSQPSGHPARGLTVAVTGVGAIIGQGIVKSLRQSRYAPRIIGIDRSADSPGPHFCDAFEQKPGASEDSQAYLDYWARIVQTHGIDLIMPGLELDMTFLDAHREFFSGLNVKLALNSAELIQKTADKWDFGQELLSIGYPGIPSALPSSWPQALKELGPAPLLLKPRRGNGSRGIVLLEDEADFNYWRQKTIVPWMLQRIVGSASEEYTVGVFGLGDGSSLSPLIFRRRLSGAGNTLVAEALREHAVIEAATERLCRHFQPQGPTNFQFRVEGETPYLLEINPRFSSSNSLRTAFGFNEAEMAIQLYLLGIRPDEPRTGVGKAWRYTEDFVTHAGHTL
ncbi:ATP-grasp domain-containing protein [Achromobacter sp. NFACC18-2]|uniref:ATP-grasp domain-containing protein n=1 Tax=Achromobacter sp. NFACC18-2 TaxID=1564112 RepID=UPI0008CADA96|nr:ATP-grasp domain-containing protein [Achromobacter sp. NFACC18-2]SEK01223.1 carbamoyl-phosphate synthase large subunit [Achromobacter sp. NFACC18-2]